VGKKENPAKGQREKTFWRGVEEGTSKNLGGGKRGTSATGLISCGGGRRTRSIGPGNVWKLDKDDTGGKG